MDRDDPRTYTQSSLGLVEGPHVLYQGPPIYDLIHNQEQKGDFITALVTEGETKD